MKLAKLTKYNGDKIWVNLELVARIEPQEKGSRLFDQGDGTIAKVEETPDQVAAMALHGAFEVRQQIDDAPPAQP